MRQFLLVLILSFLASTSFSQYHFKYRYTYYDASGKVIQPIDGSDVIYQDYYIMDGYTKSVHDGARTLMFTYQSSNNLCTTVGAEGEMNTFVSKDHPRELLKMIKLDTTAVISGYKCKAIKLVYPDWEIIYFYTNELKIDPESFKGHNYGDYYQLLTETGGALSVRFIMKYRDYSITAFLENVEQVNLSKDDFDPKYALKKYKKEVEELKNRIILATEEAHKQYPQDDIETFEARGVISEGMFALPLTVKSKRPNLALITMQIQSATFYIGTSKKYRWEYNPVKDIVEKKDVDSGDAAIDENLARAFALTKDTWKKYDAKHIIELDTAYRVVADENGARRVLYVNKDNYMLSRWSHLDSYYLVSKYEIFEGRPFPGVLTQIAYNRERPAFKASFTDVKFNMPLSDSEFEIPAHLTDKVKEFEPVKTASDYYHEGEKFMEEENYSQAIDSYREAIRINPDSKLYYNQSALAKINSEDFYGAIADLTKALDIDKRYDVAWYNLGYAKMRLGDFKHAIKDIAKAIEIDEDPTYYAKMGLCHYQLEEYDTALLHFNKAAKLDSLSGVNFWNVAMANYMLSHNEDAIKNFNKSEELDYKNVSLNNYRGISYYNIEDYESALKDFKSAVKLDPTNISYLANLGDTYSSLGESKKAIETFSKALELDSTSANMHNALGLEFYNDELYTLAIDAFTEAMKYAPNEAVYYDNRASAKEQLLDYMGAVEDYSRSLSLYPNDPRIHYLRGMAKVNLNDKFDACRDFKKARELGSEDAAGAIEQHCLE